MRNLSLLLCLCAFACSTPEAPPSSLVPFVDSSGAKERWGYEHPDGTVAIPPRYAVAEPFSAQGLAAVADSSGWHYIDTTGATVIRPLVVDNAPDSFRDGLARFEIDGQFGFFDSTGTIVIPARYDYVRPFSDGRAAFCAGCAPQKDGEHTTYAGGQWGYLDAAGAVVVAPQFDAAQPYADGTARVRRDGQWLRIDMSGAALEVQ
ncbi:MAG: hypothetical protein GVY18_17840 [Bacteroidetes bacterium]|jgi:hypothetical protein|nr:hypothetical protein [Bacteroidota bacterium]